MMAIITPSIESMMMDHLSSVRVTSSSGTIPSGSVRFSGLVTLSANRSSRQKQDEIEQEPADEEQTQSNSGNDERAAWPMFQCLGGRLGVDRRSHML
jgi:hypothetical protein